jgi:hypothetical protein
MTQQAIAARLVLTLATESTHTDARARSLLRPAQGRFSTRATTKENGRLLVDMLWQTFLQFDYTLVCEASDPNGLEPAIVLG